MVDGSVLTRESAQAVTEICEAASLQEGEIFVVGCSSSEVLGSRIGTATNMEIAEALYEGIASVLQQRGIFLAGQCCEHLNRAIVCERCVAEKYGFEEVNVVPKPHAGGAFAVKHYVNLTDPVVVESVNQKAAAGLDIGGVMIGMHIHPVVVPIRLENKNIGNAFILAARYRPKYIGGERAQYNADKVVEGNVII